MPEDPHICPCCRGDDTDCPVCEGCGEVSLYERRAYIADARAESERD